MLSSYAQEYEMLTDDCVAIQCEYTAFWMGWLREVADALNAMDGKNFWCARFYESPVFGYGGVAYGEYQMVGFLTCETCRIRCIADHHQLRMRIFKPELNFPFYHCQSLEMMDRKVLFPSETEDSGGVVEIDRLPCLLLDLTDDQGPDFFENAAIELWNKFDMANLGWRFESTIKGSYLLSAQQVIKEITAAVSALELAHLNGVNALVVADWIEPWCPWPMDCNSYGRRILPPRVKELVQHPLGRMAFDAAETAKSMYGTDLTPWRNFVTHSVLDRQFQRVLCYLNSSVS